MVDAPEKLHFEEASSEREGLPLGRIEAVEGRTETACEQDKRVAIKRHHRLYRHVYTGVTLIAPTFTQSTRVQPESVCPSHHKPEPLGDSLRGHNCDVVTPVTQAKTNDQARKYT